MAFLMGFIFFISLFPTLMMLGALVFVIFGVIGFLLLFGGITGLLMNVFYYRKTQDREYKPTSKIWDMAMIVYGIIFMLLPFIFIASGLLQMG